MTSNLKHCRVLILGSGTGARQASAAGLIANANATGGTSIACQASAPIRLYTGGLTNTEKRATIDSSGLTLTGNVIIPETTGSGVGVIVKGTDRFIHDYEDPTSNGINLFVGKQAGNFTLSDGGGAGYLASYNTGLGYKALSGLTTGYDNVAVGWSALALNTTGFQNVAVGQGALVLNTTGLANTAIGASSLAANTDSQYNTALV